MDSARIKRLIAEWSGKLLREWRVGAYINSGKSALVFRATKLNCDAAIKIFDPELVERFGAESEKERIRRELTLIGSHHENLVTILDGGYPPDNDLYFIVMEHIDAPNLASVIKNVPSDQIRNIISQVASAARFLESRDIVHRDIKPDNIAISTDFKKAKLLDLGIIRPFSADSLPPLTDREEQVFIGTLQYGSPEFLLRKEKQDQEGYRAVTFYQLGAVLFDLLEKRRLFAESAQPFPRLVQAILHDNPRIDRAGKPPDLVNLASNCLVKDPALRLKIVSWDDFAPALPISDAMAAAKENIRKRRTRALFEADSADSPSTYEEERRRKQIAGEILSRVAEQVRAASAEADLPPRFVKEIPDDQGDSQVLLTRFKASVKFGLLVDFYLGLRLKLLELGSQVVSLECAAAVSAEGISDEYLNGHWVAIFSGVYEDSIVRTAIESALFPALDYAMDVHDSSQTPARIQIPMAVQR